MESQLIDGSNPLFLHDMDKLCGICLQRIPDREKFFSITEKIPKCEPVTVILDFLQSISKFSFENKGPQSVCATCFHNVRAAYKFQLLCNQTQEYIEAFTEHQLKMQMKEKHTDAIAKEIKCSNTDNAVSVEEAVVCDVQVKTLIGPRAKCKVCHKLVRAPYLSTHLRLHTGERPYQCEICKKTFAHLTSLSMHKRFHNDNRDYICNICGKTYKVLPNLRRHMLSHSSERPYPCSVCGKLFVSQSDCNRHNRTHSGEKPFTCDVCAKRFSRRCALNLHYKIHTNDKRFACTLCDKAFIQKHSLHTHLLTHN